MVACWRSVAQPAPVIETIDCGYTMERYAAAYLMIHEGRAAFVDNNTAHAVPRMMEALDRNGLGPEDVDYCIITHVHLDHAGGSSALMKACPNATLVAHPRAARHAIDPSKLVGSAEQVYGKERFRELYGVIEPIPESRVITMEDDQTLDWRGKTLRFLHTRGHANHHFVIHDPDAKAIFTGDAFGIIYPDLGEEGVFAFASTSPTDFDGELARQAVQRIVDTGPAVAYPTHFGPVREIETVAEQLVSFLTDSEAVMNEAYASDIADEQLADAIFPRVKELFEARLAGRTIAGSPEAWERLAMDIDLNAQGLAFVAAKRRRKDREARLSS
jgi:glyoxylase-like metal-dependent hydrolase (beta-lactamase superfamily II)